eukprot:TRINITY_DN489_c0_g1_i1.p1 TRINITY_DN489_c0_g1~~TRINITY_DN489_c0_g1_i1.p1  ORF type:complete len:727 (-),score=262.40 TRINITY_DN489_c0_g1_i1:31-2154(-)
MTETLAELFEKRLTIKPFEIPEILNHFNSKTARAMYAADDVIGYNNVQHVLRERNGKLGKNQKTIRLSKEHFLGEIFKQVNAAGVKYMLMALSRDDLITLWQPDYVEHENRNMTAYLFLRKRLAETFAKHPVGEWLSTHFSKDLGLLQRISEAIEIPGAEKMKKKKASAMISAIVTQLEDIGFEMYISSFSIPKLNEFCRIQGYSFKAGKNPSKSALVSALVWDCDVEANTKTQIVELPSKKCPALTTGISIVDMVFYYSSAELRYLCKRKRLVATGTKRELATRIFGYFGGNKENLVREERRRYRDAIRNGDDYESADERDPAAERKIRKKKKSIKRKEKKAKEMRKAWKKAKTDAEHEANEKYVERHSASEGEEDDAMSEDVADSSSEDEKMDEDVSPQSEDASSYSASDENASEDEGDDDAEEKAASEAAELAEKKAAEKAAKAAKKAAADKAAKKAAKAKKVAQKAAAQKAAKAKKAAQKAAAQKAAKKAAKKEAAEKAAKKAAKKEAAEKAAKKAAKAEKEAKKAADEAAHEEEELDLSPANSDSEENMETTRRHEFDLETLPDKTKAELKEICTLSNIAFGKKATKEDLRNLIGEKYAHFELDLDLLDTYGAAALKKFCEDLELDVEEDTVEAYKAAIIAHADEGSDDENVEIDFETLQQKSLKELTELCKSLEVDLPKSATKDQIVALLEEMAEVEEASD